METETREQIANRLGLVAPVAPQEVTDYLKACEEYIKTARAFEHPRIEYWGSASEELISTNAERIATAIRRLEALKEAGEAITARGETIRLASIAYEQAKHKFEKAITDEEERPRKEFQAKVSEMSATLKKEARSLKYRMTKLSNHSHAYDSPEAQEAREQIKELRDRLSLVEYLAEELQAYGQEYRMKRLTELTEEAILADIQESAWNSKAMLKRLAEVASTLPEKKD